MAHLQCSVAFKPGRYRAAASDAAAFDLASTEQSLGTPRLLGCELAMWAMAILYIPFVAWMTVIQLGSGLKGWSSRARMTQDDPDAARAARGK